MQRVARVCQRQVIRVTLGRQGRQLLWVRGAHNPQYLDPGDTVTSVPPLFGESSQVKSSDYICTLKA